MGTYNTLEEATTSLTPIENTTDTLTYKHRILFCSALVRMPTKDPYR